MISFIQWCCDFTKSIYTKEHGNKKIWMYTVKPMQIFEGDKKLTHQNCRQNRDCKSLGKKIWHLKGGGVEYVNIKLWLFWSMYTIRNNFFSLSIMMHGFWAGNQHIGRYYYYWYYKHTLRSFICSRATFEILFYIIRSVVW